MSLTRAITLLTILNGCTPTITPLAFNEETIQDKWNKVINTQPVVWSDGVNNLDNLQSAMDSCISRYIPDTVNYDRIDYWSTPDEYKLKGGGDCEDIAICTYYKLATLGFKDIQLLIGTNAIEGHAVLKVLTNKGYYIADNNYSYPIPLDDYINKLFIPAITIE